MDVEAIDVETMDAEAMDVEVVWAAGNGTTGSARMGGAISSDARIDDGRRDDRRRDRQDCVKCYERTPKEERQRENAGTRTPKRERRRTRAWLASRSGPPVARTVATTLVRNDARHERRSPRTTSCERPSFLLISFSYIPLHTLIMFFFVFLSRSIYIYG